MKASAQTFITHICMSYQISCLILYLTLNGPIQTLKYHQLPITSYQCSEVITLLAHY